MIAALNYPLDTTTILRKKRKLKQYLTERSGSTEKRIAILGGSTTSEIKNILELFLLKHGIQPVFYESEYNKYYEDALFGSETLDTFNPDIIYIHTTHVNITTYPSLKDSAEAVDALLRQELQKFASIWSALQKYGCAIIQNNFELPPHRHLGNLDAYDVRGKTHFINRLNLEFAEKARSIKNLYINDINYLSSYIGLHRWFDQSLWYTAKYALSYEAIPELAHNLGNIINAIFGKSKKCLVLDLDNTCWGGVIGDDGLNGIQIGTETAIAEAHTYFQHYAKTLKERGVTLAVCSKNDFQNAKEGFSHPDTVLCFEDFTAFKANWDPKHLNVQDIAKEINIGIDSLVFIDDNPVERDIVMSQIPAVSVPDVGSDVTYFIDHLDRSGYFEIISLSEDDLNRNRYYEDNKKREEEASAFQDYDAFLQSLHMHAEIKSFSPIHLERITQLTNKTNQFNVTTKRYTHGEIEAIAADEHYIKLYGRLSDKFGDNGLISIVIGHIQGTACHIELWLMSCRVLKRDMEFAMLDVLVEQCRAKGVTELVGYYYKTAKNSMVADLYERFGFTRVAQNGDDSVWNMSLENYENKNQFIRIET